MEEVQKIIDLTRWAIIKGVYKPRGHIFGEKLRFYHCVTWCLINSENRVECAKIIRVE